MSARLSALPMFRVASFAAIGTFTFINAFCQSSASPAHDPRIGQIVESLEQAHTIQQTDLSPNGNLIAWNAGGIHVAPLNDSSHPKTFTACAADAKGRESSFAWSPDSKQLAFFSNCTSDH